MSASDKSKKIQINRAILFFFLTLLFSTGSAHAQNTPANPQDETQFWNETQILIPINKKTDLFLVGVLRAGANNSGFLRPIDERGGAGIAFKLSKYLTVMPTYVYVAQQPTPVRKNAEHRLILNVTPKFALGRFTFTDRNLIEFRVRHSLSNFVMYRNRLQIDYPVKIGEFGFKLFVADEAWYSTLLDTWVRNRISGGIIKQFTPHFAAEFFYLRQNDGRARPGDAHVFGTLFRINL